MESLVNYSSEDEQDEFQYSKVAVRERVSAGSGTNGGSSHGRSNIDANSGCGYLKRTNEHSRVGSSERDVSPYRKNRDVGNERSKSGNTNYYNEDRYKIDRRTDKSRDHRERREKREPKNNKDVRDDSRDYDNGSSHYKKHEDYKRFRESKRDYKRDDNDYYRDDKIYNRYDDRKSTYSSNYKDRFNSSKPRYDERKQYNERFNSDDRRESVNEERRGGGGGGGNHYDDRRREHGSDRRNDDDSRRSERRYNDDRRTAQRSFNEDRHNNTYRPRRSTSPNSYSQRNYSNNKFSERKDDVNNTRRERKRHSRSRSRSRANSPEKISECISASHNNNADHQRTTETVRPEEGTQILDKKPLPTARNFEALLNLPLSENAPKQPNIVIVPATSAASTGSSSTTATVQLPSYYNPNVINPNKYVEQMQKRKLIWGAKKSEDSASKWGHAQFSQDQDGKVASKFMRLMGIKNTTSTESSSASPNDNEKKSSSSTTPPNSADVKSREAMFSTMEHQYEVARQVTHTMRGVGLGFSSQPRPF